MQTFTVVQPSEALATDAKRFASYMSLPTVDILLAEHDFQTESIPEKYVLLGAFKLRETVFIHEQEIAQSTEWDGNDTNRAHVLVCDNEGVGGCGRVKTSDRTAKLERICVRKEKRNNGIGSTVVNALEAVASQQTDVETFRMSAQQETVDFYMKHGYFVVSEPYLEAGIPHVDMKKHAE